MLSLDNLLARSHDGFVLLVGEQSFRMIGNGGTPLGVGQPLDECRVIGKMKLTDGLYDIRLLLFVTYNLV